MCTACLDSCSVQCYTTPIQPTQSMKFSSPDQTIFGQFLLQILQRRFSPSTNCISMSTLLWQTISAQLRNISRVVLVRRQQRRSMHTLLRILISSVNPGNYGTAYSASMEIIQNNKCSSFAIGLTHQSLTQMLWRRTSHVSSENFIPGSHPSILIASRSYDGIQPQSLGQCAICPSGHIEQKLSASCLTNPHSDDYIH